MNAHLSFAAAALAAVLVSAPAKAAETVDAEKIAKICAESSERYKELFGKLPEEEPVTVITMYKYTFCPVALTVKVGTTVRFINIDKRTSHSYWFNEAGQAESERMFPGDVAEMKMEIPGEFPYLCGPHWETHGMIGRITVEP